MTGQTATMVRMETLAQSAAPLLARLRERGIQPVPVPDSHRETPEDRAERLRTQAQHRAARWHGRLPVMFRDASLADLDPIERAKVTAWLDSPSSTLCLVGAVGTGKTHAAYAVGHAAVARGTWVEAWTLADLLEALRPGGDETARDAVRGCDLLLLDDLTTLRVSEWAVEQFTTLMDHRLRMNLRQVVTTNAPDPGVLVAAWGDRAVDRLRYRWTVVTMTGTSRRVAAW